MFVQGSWRFKGDGSEHLTALSVLGAKLVVVFPTCPGDQLLCLWQAAVLPGPRGALEVMVLSVDELRPLLARARVCLQRAVFEPVWLKPLSRRYYGSLEVRELPAWREVLAAAEQLINM
jgi:hypothetical protein